MNQINILWRGSNAIVVDKPVSLPTQAPSGIESLESLLRHQLADQSSYVAMPHRLDRDVSGVIVVALSKKAARLLSDQFAARKTRKRYCAVVHGRLDAPDDHPLVWQDDLRKVPDQPRAEVCSNDADGAKHAITNVRPLAYDPLTDTTRLQLWPVTGRMHQLRVQSAARGHAILGDPTYKTGASNCRDQECFRLHLHADRLEFFDPANGSRRVIESPCPF